MDLITANKLKTLRKEKGLSQDALAEMLGISRQSISKWERGESSPDTDNLLALAQVYGITVDEIINSDKPVEKKDDNAKSKKEEKVERQYAQIGKALFKFPMPLIIVAIYLAASMITKEWHPKWIIFLLIPIYYHFAGACYTKTKKGFLFSLPIPEIIIMVYLFFGLYLSKWAMPAILFIIIPIYYWMVALYKKK